MHASHTTDWSALLRLLSSRVDAAAVESLELRSFELEKQFELAFRTLQSGSNTGKVVVRMPVQVHTDAAGHVVAGGTSG